MVVPRIAIAFIPQASWGRFPAALPTRWVKTNQDLTREFLAALRGGQIERGRFVASLKRTLPHLIAEEAIAEWKRENPTLELHPYRLRAPGDVLQDLSRSYEFTVYRRHEALYSGPRLAHALFGSESHLTDESAVAACIDRFEHLYAVCLSASQARRSRAGSSFEYHLGEMFKTGGIPFEPQKILDGTKPDNVLPSRDIYADKSRRSELALIVTLKTSLRERWKQVLKEGTRCPIYLATLDPDLSSQTLDKLAAEQITLVVPERLRDLPGAAYDDRPAVISFRTFFDRLKAERADLWRAAGIRCFET